MSEKKTIEFDEECPSCGGSGVYVGIAENNSGIAVKCGKCDGSGCHHFVYKYTPFTKRHRKRGIKRVVQVNPGINMRAATIDTVGGLPYNDWFDGKPFPARSEMRKYVCPLQWYNGLDQSKQPNWDECAYGAFRDCPHFCTKDLCWQRYDKEHAPKAATV